MKLLLSLAILIGGTSAFAGECPNFSGSYEFSHAGQNLSAQIMQNGCDSLIFTVNGEAKTILLNGVQTQVDTHFEISKLEGSKLVSETLSPDSECQYTANNGSMINFYRAVETIELSGNSLVITEVGYDKSGKELFNEKTSALRK